MSKSAELLKLYSQLKSVDNAKNTQDIMDAIKQYDDNKGGNSQTSNPPVEKVNTNIDVTKDIPVGYEEALSRIKQYQTILTPALFNKYPDAKPLYDAITKQGAERYKTFDEKMPDYYLTSEEQKGLLKDKYNQYLKDMQLVGKFFNHQYQGATDIRGTEEGNDNPLLYGLRSASLFQYTGEPRKGTPIEKVQEAGKIMNIPKTLDNEDKLPNGRHL